MKKTPPCKSSDNFIKDKDIKNHWVRNWKNEPIDVERIILQNFYRWLIGVQFKWRWQNRSIVCCRGITRRRLCVYWKKENTEIDSANQDKDHLK